MISLILAEKIASLFLILFAGLALVRLHILRAEDSKLLSAMSLYFIYPCVCLAAFQVDYTPQVRDGLVLAYIAAVLMNLLAIALAAVLGRLLHLDPVEKTSVGYSNAGNLVIPIVTALLGQGYVIYTCAYITVMQFLFWRHLKMTLCGERRIELKKIFGNPNMIAVLAGMVMMVLRLSFPPLVMDAVQSTADMVGPISMFITGMLLGGMDLKRVLSYRRVWLVAALRLVALPLVSLAVLKFTPLYTMVPDGRTILLITLLAASAPAASTVTQMAQYYGRDAEYASANNVVTTLLCIFTMPLIVQLYQL